MASERRSQSPNPLLGLHFRRSEFDSHDGARSDPSPELITALERLRSICGDRPLRIVSGFRSAGWNKRVGGASHSQHLYNRAADIPAGYATLAQARRAGFRGCGLSGVWVTHVDVRLGRPATWHYS